MLVEGVEWEGVTDVVKGAGLKEYQYEGCGRERVVRVV